MFVGTKIESVGNKIKTIKNTNEKKVENNTENKIETKKSKSKFNFSELLNFEGELKIIENIGIENNNLDTKEKKNKKKKTDKKIKVKLKVKVKIMILLKMYRVKKI